MLLFKKSIIYPYGINLKRDGNLGFIPAVPVKIFSPDKNESLNLILLIDSGAELTFLTSEDAEMLKIKKEKGKKVLIGGITNKNIGGYIHILPIFLAEREIKIPIIFSISNNTPRVLGRKGVFEKFYIIFDEKDRKIIFVPREENCF